MFYGAYHWITIQKFNNYINVIYSKEPEIKDTTDAPKWANYLVLCLEFDEDGKLYTRLHDKRDDFDFPAVNFQYWSIIFLNPLHSVATRVGFGDEWWEIHLTWKAIQNAFSHILYTLRHLKKAKYNVKSWRSWKPCEMDLSHNCSLHGGRSEVSENPLWLMRYD